MIDVISFMLKAWIFFCVCVLEFDGGEELNRLTFWGWSVEVPSKLFCDTRLVAAWTYSPLACEWIREGQTFFLGRYVYSIFFFYFIMTNGWRRSSLEQGEGEQLHIAPFTLIQLMFFEILIWTHAADSLIDCLTFLVRWVLSKGIKKP